MKPSRRLWGAAVIAAALSYSSAAAAAAMQWSDLLSRPKPAATQRITYGFAPQEFGDLWLPPGRGKHPLVVMIHGGCWTKSVATLEIMNYVAEDLRMRGVAVWNIEYRGIDEPGGGYPGTYQDVASAIEAIRPFAKPYGLDLKKTIFLGHSAGGHLALWAAARARLPRWSRLYSRDALRPAAVVDLAGIPDLQLDKDTGCGPEPVTAIAGPATTDRPDVFADTSPEVLTPLHVPQYIIHGVDDVTVKPRVGFTYSLRARDRGDKVTLSYPPGGHVEEIAPGTPSWDATANLIVSLTR